MNRLALRFEQRMAAWNGKKVVDTHTIEHFHQIVAHSPTEARDGFGSSQCLFAGVSLGDRILEGAQGIVRLLATRCDSHDRKTCGRRHIFDGRPLDTQIAFAGEVE